MSAENSPAPSATFRFAYSGSPFADIEETVETARQAEQAGFGAFVLADLAGALSPMIALTAVARATTTIRVMPFVLNTGLWNPALLGRDLASLDRASGGRLDIALGSGIPTPLALPVMPPTPEARFARLGETVAALKTTFADQGLTPGFVGRPRLTLSATGDRTLQLAAEETDGVFIAGVPPVPRVALPPGELVLPERSATERYLERLRGFRGSRDGAFEVGTSSGIHLTDDAEAEATRIAATHTYLTAQQVLQSPKILIGTVDEIAAQIVQRGEGLGLTYQVLRGAGPEALAPLLARFPRSAAG